MDHVINIIDLYCMEYNRLDDEMKKKLNNIVFELIERLPLIDLINLYIEMEKKQLDNNINVYNLISKNSLYNELNLQVLLSSNSLKIERLELYSKLLGSWMKHIGSAISKRINNYSILETQEMLEQLINKITMVSSQSQEVALKRSNNYDVAINSDKLRLMADSLDKTETEVFDALKSEFSELAQQEVEFNRYLMFYKMFERELSSSLNMKTSRSK